MADIDSMTARKLYSLIFGRPSNFSWVRKDKLAGSGMPSGQRAFRWLRDHGVSAIITLTEEGLNERLLREYEYVYKHHPLVNRAPAEPASLDSAVDYITSQVQQGRKVLVHCQAGQGRTGMVLAAYLIKTEGKSADEAIQEVRKIRPGSLKRESQREALKKYEMYLKSHRSDGLK